MQARHPVIQHAVVLILVVLALLLLTVTASVNPHSTAWLAGAFLCLIVTVLSFRHADSDSQLRSAYRLYTSCMGLYFLVVWLLHISIPTGSPATIDSRVVLWAKIFRAGTIFLPVCYLRFTRVFTKSDSAFVRGLEGSAWCAALVFYATNWFDMFAVSYRWSGRTWAPTLGGAYRFFFYYTIVVIGFSTVYSAIKLARSEQKQQRVRLFYFLIGSIPLWLTIMSNFLLSIGINVYPAAGFFFIAHISILAYAVLRRNVFEVSISLGRGLAYALASLCLGGTYGGLLWFLTHHSGLGSESVNFFIAPLFMAICGFFLAPFIDAIQSILDRVFFRAASNRQRAFDELTLATSRSIQLPQLAEALCQFFKGTLQPKKMNIYLLTRKGHLTLYAVFTDKITLSSWPNSSMLPLSFQPLAKVGAISEVDIQGADIPVSTALSLTTSHRGLIADISHNDKLMGCVILHPKLADEVYTVADQQLVRTAIAHSSLAISNAYSFQKLEELQSQTLRLLNGLSVGVVSIDADGKILQANAAAKRIVGKREDIDDLQFGIELERQVTVHSIVLNALKSGRDLENRELTLNGTRHILVNTQSHRNEGDQKHVTLLLHDITDYKSMEETLRRNAGLTQAGEMIAGINHEIRNVFQPIKYQVRILNRNQDRAEEDILALQVMTERLAAMDTLLENLKNLARPIHLRKHLLDLSELIESVWRDLSNLPTAASIEFSISTQGETSVEADGHWLRQVFYNIQRNAIEALAGRENATLTVWIRECEELVEISFTDNGPGVPEEVLPRLFTPFVSTKGAAGTGLGLTVSRRAVELHSGTLAVESSNAGTTFRIRLPRAKTAVPVSDK